MQKDEIIKKTAEIIRKHLGSGYRIILFGSWARGNALEASDIDMGILGKEKAQWDAMVKIREEVGDIPTLRKIDVVDLNLVDEGFKKSALKYAKTL